MTRILLAVALLTNPTMAAAQFSPEQQLIASDGEEGDGFGSSVALDGDTALIGAASDDVDGALTSLLTGPPITGSHGSVYVFTRSGTTWAQRQHLVASDAAEGDFFGFSVALDGDTALIGAPGKDVCATCLRGRRMSSPSTGPRGPTAPADEGRRIDDSSPMVDAHRSRSGR